MGDHTAQAEDLRAYLTSRGWVLVRPGARREVWLFPKNSATYHLYLDICRKDTVKGARTRISALETIEVIKNELVTFNPHLPWNKWVQAVREATGRSRAEVAHTLKMGDPRHTIKRVEQGLRKFSPTELEQWMRIFGNPQIPSGMTIPVMDKSGVARQATYMGRALAKILGQPVPPAPPLIEEEPPMSLPFPNSKPVNRRANLLREARNILMSDRLTVSEVEQLVTKLREGAKALVLGSSEIFK